MTCRSLAIALSVLLLPTPTFGQSVGVISGQVTDETGGVLPGSTVEVTNENTGIVQTLVTDPEGRYRARSLALGRYSVKASLAGFQAVIRSGIRLTIDREATVDFKLAIGELAEAITVGGDAPLVDTQDSGMTSLVTREQLTDLPLNARDYSQLIAIQPGTTYYRSQGGSEQSGYGARISVSGARVTSNVFTLDGTDIQTSSGLLPSGVTGATLGLEAVQEFKILTSNYSAQYGRGAGATILAATRSGTNEFHGSAYWYHRNDGLDARNFFDDEKPEFDRNQAGFSLGGRILQDRTFFFTNFELLREGLPQRLNGAVPTADARRGILPDRTVTVDPNVQRYLELWPLPTGEDFGDGTAEFQRTSTQQTDQDYFSARVDHNFGPRHAIFARYTMDQSEVLEPQTIPLYETVRSTRQQYVTVEQRSVLSPRFLNQIRAGFTRDLMNQNFFEVNPPDPSFAFYAGRPIGTIQVSGLTALEGGADPNKRVVSSMQVHDDASFDVGRHSIRFGGSVTRFEYNRNQLSRAGGEWTFGSLVDFLQNRPPTRLRIMGFNATESVTFNQTLAALYLQDDIEIGDRVTFNAGVRYEYLTVPTERDDQVSTVPDIRGPERVGDPLYINPGAFAAPRVGLAWDVRGDGRTSIRTNFGLFHEPLLVKYYLNSLARVPPFWREADPALADLPGLFPDLNPHLERLSGGPQAIHAFEYEPSNPYTTQWSLSLQQMLGANLVGEVAYTGSKGRNLGSRKDFAIPERQVVNGETYNPPEVDELLNPNFTRFEWYGTTASSEYHALKLNLTKRYSSGLHLQGSYTWSKAMDTQSAVLSGELADSKPMDTWDEERDWGLADFHVEHVFTGNVGYELPFGRNLDGLAGQLARGWQASGIVTLTSGTPFTPESHSALTHPLARGGSARPDPVEGYGDPILGGTDAYFDVTQFQPQRQGFFGTLGRNTLIGPGFAQVDTSVIKNFSIADTGTAQFRLEIFNVLNRANFALPSASLFDSRGARVGSAGRITRTVGSARQIQLAVRFEF